MRLFLWLILPCLLHNVAYSQGVKIAGQIKDGANNPLPFASIIIKGTTLGTSANSLGFYNIEVKPGEYFVLVQHVGFKSEEKKVSVSDQDVYADFILQVQQYDLGNLVVKNNEDQAYQIIRSAIKKRSFYENELDRFKTGVYIKGLLQLRDFPDKFLGQKINFEDGDTSKKKVIFLSETVANYAVNGEKSKVEVVSTKVSGQQNGFGFSNPQILSFYKNIVEIDAINPRGFVSPIANNALNFYEYLFEGTFFDNGQMVNRIRVIPRRLYEPVFNGYINIIENQWRIHSLQLSLYKKNQVQFVDTLLVEQIYAPIGNTMVIKQQNLLPSFSFFGFNGFGSFVQVYDNYDLDPVFEKNYFNNTILKFTDSANKKSIAYWDSIRPIPLVAVEIKDYQKKDSLELLRQDPAYLDSLDRVRNKLNLSALILTGQTWTNQKKKSSITLNSLLYAVLYNTVEGLAVDINPTFTKKWSDNKRNRITVAPQLRYGFSNRHFNPNVLVRYDYGQKYRHSVSALVGKKVFQFDNRGPVREFSNTIASLYFNKNYLKIYEAYVGRFLYSKGIGEGLTLNAQFEYQNRMPLANTTDYKWRNIEGLNFTPNLSFAPHQASIATVNISWQPGSKYVEFPDRKVMIGSDYPLLSASFVKGISGLFSSDVEYSTWRVNLSQDVNMKLAGQLNYNVAAGGFFSDKKVFLQDQNHFLSNRFASASPYLQSFQLMEYYKYSNSSKAYVEHHLEYHLNGLLTNKVPGFRKLNWFLVAGNNQLYINGGRQYGELFLGLENIFKIARVDFVQAFTEQGWKTSGIRFTLLGLR